MNRRCLAAVAVAALSSPLPSAVADTITVCAEGCDYTSINAAIAVASDGDVIQLAAETYFEGEQIDTLGKAITLRGVLSKTGHPASVLDGAGKHRVLICQSGETDATVFENLVIQSGFVTESSSPATSGGGMFNKNSSPTLTDCVFTGNTAHDDGGGMYNQNSSPILTDCVFTGNSASKGWGGGVSLYDSSPMISNCSFVDNTAGFAGGGLNAESASFPKLLACEFLRNTAVYQGGAIDTFVYDTQGPEDPFLQAEDCVFSENTALGGDGILGENARVDLIRCVFADKISNSYGNWTLTDCIFTECCLFYPPRSFIDLGGNDYESWCNDCRANIDCRNNAVDAGDLGYLLARWGTDDPQSDLDEDGTVTASDLGLLIAAWGPCN